MLVTGPRQVGKTTLLELAAKSARTRITLDDPQIRELASRDPALFFQTFPPPLLLDEVQYAPQLFPCIKMIADRERKNGLFWMAGSRQFHFMKGVTESLAGRVAILQLQGFSQAEKQGDPKRRPFLPERRAPQDCALSLREVYALIHLGSHPALRANPKTNAATFYASCLRTCLARDVSDLLRVTDGMAFLRFMKTAVARTGRLLNYADMARDVNVSQNTIKSWLSVLQTSGLIHLLQPYHANLVATLLIKMPKLYFLDTGLCRHLTGWSSPEALEAGAMSGALLEAYVVSEILKSHWHHGLDPSVFFYREKERREIDLLIEADGKLHPVEIKKTAAPSLHGIRHFKWFREHYPAASRGAVICFTPRPLPLTSDTDALPVGAILQNKPIAKVRVP